MNTPAPGGRHRIPGGRGLRTNRRFQTDLQAEIGRHLPLCGGFQIRRRRAAGRIAEADGGFGSVFPATGVARLILRLLAVFEKDRHSRRFGEQEVAIANFHGTVIHGLFHPAHVFFDRKAVGFDCKTFELRQPLIDKKRAMVSDRSPRSGPMAAVHVMALVERHVESKQRRKIGWTFLLAEK